jgi:DsbC/DsbD-like thiol-disulfide interchange protein
MIRLAILFVACGTAVAIASPAAPAERQKWYEKAVKKVEGTFTPAEAKPGQTVTFTLTVELNAGYHTYPTVQTDKGAAGMVNEIKFPNPDKVIFVGTTQDPKDVKTKPEPELNIAELRYCTGTAVYTRKAVVSPKAAAGTATVKLTSFNLSVCDEDNCFPPKKVPVEATLKVLDGPAVPVEKEFADEVKKALGEK